MDDNKLTIKENTGKVKKADPLFTVFMKTYYDWFEKKVGIKPKIDVADGRALQLIVKYFRSITENPFVIPSDNIELLPLTDEQILERNTKNSATVAAWDYIFAHYDRWDKFYQKQLNLRHINSNLMNIINSINNGKSATGPKSIADLRNEIGNLD